MILKKGKFILDHISNSPISFGVIIRKEFENTFTDIAKIFWSCTDNDCFIQTIGPNFQDNVVLYDDFKDFIYLVDEAYNMVSLTNGKKEVTGFENESINI